MALTDEYNLLRFVQAAIKARSKLQNLGFEAFHNRAAWIQPFPNTIAVQLNWAAIPAYGRYLKLFGGPPRGSLPTQSFGYAGLGMVVFRGLIVRRLR